jgi:phosphohistidine phosphatase
MRTLTLLRHAKSSREHPGLDDHRRPLAPRGQRAAPAMARHLLDMGQIPERVLCSDAVRTRQTWLRVSDVWSQVGHFPATRFIAELYLASAATLLEQIHGVHARVENLMLVGHNPGLHELVLTLARADVADPTPLARVREKLPTGAVVVLEIPVGSWTEVAPGTAVVADFVRPKDLPGAEELAL